MLLTDEQLERVTCVQCLDCEWFYPSDVTADDVVQHWRHFHANTRTPGIRCRLSPESQQITIEINKVAIDQADEVEL